MTEKNIPFSSLPSTDGQFQALVSQVPLSLWRSDAQGVRNFFNKAWLDFTGTSLEQELNGGWTKRIHEKDFPMVKARLSESALLQKEFILEYRLLSKDGTYHWMEDHAVPLLNDPNGGNRRRFQNGA